MCAALLPWFAIFSGTYGLYFYVVLFAVMLTPRLLIPLLVLAAPLAMLLLVLLPAGVIYAAVRCPPSGWSGRLTRAGCLASMGFTIVYTGLMVAMTVVWFLSKGVDARWEPFMAWRIAVLVFGLWATWRAWRWLRRRRRQG